MHAAVGTIVVLATVVPAAKFTVDVSGSAAAPSQVRTNPAALGEATVTLTTIARILSVTSTPLASAPSRTGMVTNSPSTKGALPAVVSLRES